MTTISQTAGRSRRRSGPAAGQPSRLSNEMLATLLVVATETMFFVGLVFAATQIRRAAPVWPPDGSPLLTPGLLAVNTALLVGSSLLAHRALRATQAGDRKAARRWVSATVALGAFFLLGQLAQFAQLGGWRPAEGVYATLFQILSGFHGLHAAAGLAVWLLVSLRLRRSRAVESAVTPALTATAFWHFVTLVWLALLVAWIWP